MIIDRAYIREVTQTSAAVALVVLSIFAVVRLVRFLSRAASGEIPVDSIFLLLALKVVTYLDLILPLAMFAAILMVMGRWVRDNEMTVLHACGVGLAHLLRPTLVLVFVLAAIVASFSLYLSPIAVTYSDRVTEEGKQRVDISGVVPGVFTDRQGRGVYYVERIGEKENTLINVFVYGQSPEGEDVVIAKDGYQYVDEQTGDRFLVLRDGTRFEGSPGQADYRVLEFETYALRIKAKVEVRPVVSMKAMPTAKLLRSDNPKAVPELHWRISKPLMVPILAMLALSFTTIGVRKSQFLKMVAAFGTYFVYANLLGYANALVQKGKVGVDVGLWWVHVLFAALAVYMFMRRARNRPLLLPARLRLSFSRQ